MVKHVILWQLDASKTDEEKKEIKANMKRKLEELVGVVPGLVKLDIQTEPLASANADVMLDSLLESEEALKGYAEHPAHVEVANKYVRPYAVTRVCMDYEV